MLARLTQEAIGGLDPIALPHLNLSVLNHMRHVLAEEHFLERLHRFYVALLERDEGETTAPARHLVTHDCHIDNLAKSLEVGLYIGLYIHAQYRQDNIG